MRVLPVNHVFFSKINARVCGVDINLVKSLDSIEKIAAEKHLDIFINVSKNTELLKDKLFLFAMASKAHSTDRGSAKLFIYKNIKQEELSVKLYNIAMMAIESLENKIKKLNNKK